MPPVLQNSFCDYVRSLTTRPGGRVDVSQQIALVDSGSGVQTDRCVLKAARAAEGKCIKFALCLA